MSYTIEFDRQFIQSETGITPLWLSGDNNFTTGYGRGEKVYRSWSVFLSLLGVQKEDILNAIGPSLHGYQEHWKKNGKYLDDDALIKWVRNGCRSAATVEDILDANPTLGSIECSVLIYDDAKAPYEILRSYVKTTESFDAWLYAARDMIDEINARKQNGARVEGYPIVKLGEDVIHHPKKSKKTAGPSDDVVIKIGKQYLTSYEPRESSSWSIYAKDAQVMTREEASKAIASGDIPCHAMPTIVNASVKGKPYNGIIQIVGGVHDGKYITSITKGSIRITTRAGYARRYPDLKAAEAAVKRLEPRRSPSCPEFKAITLETDM